MREGDVSCLSVGGGGVTSVAFQWGEGATSTAEIHSHHHQECMLPDPSLEAPLESMVLYSLTQTQSGSHRLHFLTVNFNLN